MTLKQQLEQDKLTVIAMYVLVQEHAAELEVTLAGTVSSMCRDAGVNRTQIYERKDQLDRALSTLELAGPGRPVCAQPRAVMACTDAGCAVRERVLRYRLEHPGAVVHHTSATTSYSDGFRRFLLDCADEWLGAMETFCAHAQVPLATWMSWRRRDRAQPYTPQPPRPVPLLAYAASEACRTIVEDYAIWDGSQRDFLSHEARRLHLSPSAVRRVLRITGMVAVRPRKPPRYRGSTHRVEPGAVVVTDGKTLDVLSTHTGEFSHYTWQAMVDQSTACHTGAALTETECAAGVHEVFDQTCALLGRPPLALVHDNKPIHDDAKLRAHIEPTTRMIPATLARPENKAVVEGEFGKFEQAVGAVYLDDRSLDSLKRSALSEVLRAYTAAVNHAARAELHGKSRLQVLRQACPDPEKDRAFIEQLHAEHTAKRPPETLPTQGVARRLLDAAFARFALGDLDPNATLRDWLSARYTPEAIRQAIAVFATEYDKGRLRTKTAHRYLVKLIQNCQHELDLRAEEHLLREFAETERQAWIQEFEHDLTLLEDECQDPCTVENDLSLRLSEKAVFASMLLERAFWEQQLKTFLAPQRHRIGAVCRHLRRLYEAHVDDRFQLISALVSWEFQLAAT